MNMLSTTLAILERGQANGWTTTIMILLIIVIFYFFLIRPQSQKAKEEENFRKGLQKGDKVMTAGGIHGRFVGSDGVFATIEVAENTRIKVQLSTLIEVKG